MTAETDEFLRGLYGYDPERDDGPYVNWTAGFEANPEEYEEYLARLAASGPDRRRPALPRREVAC